MGEKGEKVDPKIIKKTQDNLAKIIKKPPLTEKLLGKPPFRFLHDIFTSVIKSTGFMKGLFTETEMNSENVKDKESKIAFLQKAIDMVSLVVGKPVAAKPSRIVAGLEADRTNEFLQYLAEAVNKKVNNDEYVARILKTDSSKPPSGSSKKERDHSSDKRRRDKDDKKHRSKEDGEKRESSKDRTASTDREHKDRDRKERHKDRERSHDRRERKERDSSKGDRDRKEDGEKDRDRHRDKDREKKKRHQERDEEEKENAANEENLANASPDVTHQEQEPPARIPRPTSAKGSRRRHGHGPSGDSSDEDEEEQQRQEQQRREQEKSARINGNVDEDDVPPQVAAARKMARPSSARPAPPRVKKNETVPDEPVIMGSSNVPNLIVDKKGDSDSEEEDAFITKDDEAPAPVDEPAHSKPEAEDDGEHGGLVKKMLETKKELEGGSQQATPGKKTEIERSHMTDATKRKEREMVQKDINKLRTSIQTLTRSVNPLGKILDFLQEDLDSMQKELDVWKKENKQNALALQREQSITESSIEPLKAQLTELDQAINDQLDLIAAVKSNILKNDEKTQKMLGTVTKS